MILDINEIQEIEMDLTGYCNLKCPLCTRNYSHAKHMLSKNIRSIKDIIAQLESFTELKRFFIAGAVSEPTLYPEFLEFIRYLNSRNITYELFTNGNTNNIIWWKELGSLMSKDSICVFTICGSTQELHSKYRVGSSLSQILENATAFKSSSIYSNDWIQHIQFDYNTEDLPNMKNIFKKFSNVMLVQTEGIRRQNSHIKQVPFGVSPVRERDTAIKYIFSRAPKVGEKVDILCKSFLEKKVYINQYGKIAPCYIHAENEQHFFDTESSSLDYSKILAFNYQDCFLCEKSTTKLISALNLDFVC